MRLNTRSIRILAGAIGATTLLAAAPGSEAAVSGQTRVTLVPGGTVAKSLRAQGVRMAGVRPARLSGGVLRLPVQRIGFGTSTVIRHRGGLSLRKGKRKVVLRAFELRLGGGPRISAQMGSRRPALLAVKLAKGRRPRLDREARSASLSGAQLRLTRAGARTLRLRLRLRTAPRGALGRLSMLATDPPPQPSPRPTQGVPPSSASGACPTPSPVDPSTPRTTWEASHLPGESDRRSWIEYILGFGEPPAGSSADIVPTEGAEHLYPSQADPRHNFDFSLPATSSSTTGGVTTVGHVGQVQETKPLHGIDQRTRNLVFEVPAAGSGRTSGRVFADGQASQGGPSGGSGPAAFACKHLLDLSFAGISPTTGLDGSLVYADVPSTVVTGSPLPSQYYGKSWGRFDIVVPPATSGP